MIILIKDATAIGESEKYTVGWGKEEANATHSFQVSTNGSPTELTIEIDGTINGEDFTCIAKHVLTQSELLNNTAIFHVVNKPVPVIKAKITALSGGLSPEISVYYYKGK